MTIDKLPNGWTRLKFGDVVRNCNENSRDLEADGVERVVGLDHLDPGSLRLVRWGELAELPDGTTFTRKFRPSQVLFGKRRAYQRKVAVPDFAGVCSGDILVFEPADERMLADFLPYVVQSDGFFDHALGTSAGSLSPRTKWAELAKYEFALPPIDEQKRIASLMRAIDSLQMYVSSALDQVESLHTAIIAASTSELDPDNWRQLGEVCQSVKDGPFGSKIKSEHYRPSGARVVRLQNIGIGEFLDKDAAFIGLDYYEELRSSHGFQAGDLVVAGLGDEANPLGRAAAVPDAMLPAVNKADCFLVRPGPNIVSEYLLLALNSRDVLSDVAAQARGTTRSRISSGSYKQLSVPVPDLATQREVVARAAEVGQLRNTFILELKFLRQLRKSMLNTEVGHHVQ